MNDPAPDPSFVPISPNPFIVGNPVRGRTMFFGRDSEFELVRARFKHSDHGGLLVFCGERRSGKTSILFQILDHRLGPEFIPVLIDMQSMAISGEADFLAKIVLEILEALGPGASGVQVPDFANEANRALLFQTFIEQVLRRNPGHKLILLFDEYELFENKIDSGILGSDVLMILSSLMEHQSVFLIFTGSQHLEQRRRDYWKILGKSIWKQISYLERTDALRLMCEPVENRARYDAGALDAIYRLTAGQPFYTQAVCQSLVDVLNERRTGLATVPMIAEVADGLVNNPLPQMIFLWDSLEREQKLVLALLAEALPDDRTSVGAAALASLIRKRDYPLELSHGQLATALETSFRSELLTKDDTHQPPTYAFRMDLWRLWIRRMHSLWQVMREEGLEIRVRRGLKLGAVRVPWMWLPAAAAILGVTAWVAVAALRGRPPAPPGLPTAPAGSFVFSLETEPAETNVFLDGALVSKGSYRGAITLDHPHALRLTAPGYADTALTLASIPGRPSLHMKVTLLPLLGDLRIETQPPGATVRVDGVARGVSPVLVRDLAVAMPHVVEAALAGRAPRSESRRVESGRLTTLSWALDTPRTDLVVTTDPPSAAVAIDGGAAEAAPRHVANLAVGNHKFTARLDGYSATDTTVSVGANLHQIHLALAAEPPGQLVIQGDRPAQIYVDATLVGDNVPNSVVPKLRPGPHQVHIVLVSGDVVDNTIVVRSGERSTFDYSKNTVTRSH